MASIVGQGVAGLVAVRGVGFRPQQQQQRRGRRGSSMVAVRAEVTSDSSVAVNPGIKKDSEKVVDTVVVSSLEKPTTAFCRCWRSGTFPLCDGSHAKYNKATGDNLGPLLVKK